MHFLETYYVTELQQFQRAGIFISLYCLMSQSLHHQCFLKIDYISFVIQMSELNFVFQIASINRYASSFSQKADNGPGKDEACACRYCKSFLNCRINTFLILAALRSQQGLSLL